MRYRFLSILALAAAGGSLGCDDDASAPLMAPPSPTSGSAAFLTVSNPAAAAGSIVTVTAAVRGAQDVARVGAFTAHLDYDAAGLEYVGESAIAGGMRALRAREASGTGPASITAAGATAGGFTDDRLFAVRFRVMRAGALESLTLRVSELTGTDFKTQIPKLQVRRGMHAAAR